MHTPNHLFGLTQFAIPCNWVASWVLCCNECMVSSWYLIGLSYFVWFLAPHDASLGSVNRTKVTTKPAPHYSAGTSLYVHVRLPHHIWQKLRHRTCWPFHSTSSLMSFAHSCHTQLVCCPCKLVCDSLGGNCSNNQKAMKHVPLWDCSEQIIRC